MKYAYWMFCVKTLGNRKKIALWNWSKGEEKIYRMDKGALENITEEIVSEGGERLKRKLLSEKNIESILQSKQNWDLEKEMERLQQKGILFTPYEREGYPKGLLQIPDPPYALTTIGKLPSEGSPILAIIGARNCSEYGKYVAREFARYLAESGVQIISGMAAGIDGISQKACLDAGAYSLGVLGCGVDICYPEQNRALYEELKTKGGVLSEYFLGTSPKASLFPPRNRIISGISDAVLVVEAKQKSGTLITVDMALEQGKDVYAIPGRVTDPLSLGCNQLIRQGAGIITTPQDLLYELKKCGALLKTNQAGCKQNNPKNIFTMIEQQIYSHLDICPKSLNQIYEEITRNNEKQKQIHLPVLIETLMELELKGAIHSAGGSYYVLQ